MERSTPRKQVGIVFCHTPPMKLPGDPTVRPGDEAAENQPPSPLLDTLLLSNVHPTTDKTGATIWSRSEDTNTAPGKNKNQKINPTEKKYRTHREGAKIPYTPPPDCIPPLAEDEAVDTV